MRATRSPILPFAVMVVLAVGAAPSIHAAEADPGDLLGKVTPADLRSEPYAAWYVPGHDDYEPNGAFVETIRTHAGDDVTIQVFFGTWCGDSRREVPRFAKLLEVAGLGRDRVSWIGVDRTDERHKRSPGGEERGLDIWRVPTMIVRRGGDEVARIVENPVLSLERDLAAILAGERYEPNYRSYPTVRRWLAEGLLSDPNVSPRGLAGLLDDVVEGEGELAAAGRVLLSRGDVDEAVALFEVNRALYRASAWRYADLARGYAAQGRHDEARSRIERALELNDDPREVADLLAVIEPR